MGDTFLAGVVGLSLHADGESLGAVAGAAALGGILVCLTTSPVTVVLLPEGRADGPARDGKDKWTRSGRRDEDEDEEPQRRASPLESVHDT